MNKQTELLVVNELCKSFELETSPLKKLIAAVKDTGPDSLVALNNVSFVVNQGETLGVLGESGSGKSTLARVLMGIYSPDSGTAFIGNKSLFDKSRASRLEILARMQMVFQDPFASLDPRMTVRQIITEPLKIHGRAKVGEAFLTSALEEVGLDATALDRYPTEFSGGQRQRIGICRAIILAPELIIADEAVSALDVSVQAQIIELLCRLRQERQLSMIFISHDVAVVRQIADRIILLYKGHLVEEMPADCLLKDAVHPYTRRLLSAAVYLREGTAQNIAQPVNNAEENEAKGCCFRAQCPLSDAECAQAPGLLTLHPGHKVACHKVARLVVV